MSDTSSDVFSVIGNSWTIVSRETYTQITLRESGPGLDGPEIVFRIERSLIRTFIASFRIETWRNGDRIYRTTWERLGRLHDHLKFLSPLWRISKPAIVAETLRVSSPRPSQASPDGGNGRLSNSRLQDALQRLLAGEDISSADQETIRLYAKLLLSCLSPPRPTE